jgi:hypothetical protein
VKFWFAVLVFQGAVLSDDMMNLFTCLLATFLAFYTSCAFRRAVDVFFMIRDA